MISINSLYYNKNRAVDVVTVISIEYIEGQKKVVFSRPYKDSTYELPIEMFKKNFREVNGPT